MEFAAAALSTIGAAAPTAISGTTLAGATVASTGAIVAAGTPFATLIGGAGVTGAGVASAGLLGALGSTSGWASILQGGATVGSVLAASRAGKEDARKLEFQALDAETEISVEEIKGLERRNSIKAALVEAIGERDVAAAASGVDLTFGTPVTARRQASEDAERAIGNDQATEDFRKSRLRERAANYRLAAAQRREGGLLKAVGLGLEGAAKFLRRG